MKKLALSPILLLLFGSVVLSQPIPTDSMYLGQILPGSNPVIFNLPVTSGLRPVERITISSDGKEIYYSELNSWPATDKRIKCFKYNGSWQGPVISFEGFLAPSLSDNDSIMYMQKDTNSAPCTYYSTRNDTGWNTPVRLLSTNLTSHYFQETQLHNQYLASTPNNNSDICQLIINYTDTIIQSLGLPINTPVTENDFYIARDESFIIVFWLSSPYDMFISYNNGNGNWTNPKSLGININTPIYDCSPYVTRDNKYLFFTRGASSMSSYYTYWVQVDTLIDSLRNTNFTPYSKYVIPNQTDTVGQLFGYTIPDSAFFDDDGNNTLIYSATNINGTPLPAWLIFDPGTRSFSGTPTTAQTVNIKVKVTDTEGATAYTIFKIFVISPAAIDQISESGKGFKIFPNPSNGLINISSSESSDKTVILEIFNLEGKIIVKDTFINDISIDLTSRPKGLYGIKLITDKKVVTGKFCLE